MQNEQSGWASAGGREVRRLGHRQAGGGLLSSDEPNRHVRIGTLRAGRGRTLPLIAAILAIMLASGLANAGFAKEIDRQVLNSLTGRWSGFGSLRTGRAKQPQRVDCNLDLDWNETSGTMRHALVCRGQTDQFAVSGQLAHLGGREVLSGFVTISDQAGESFAHCELKGRTLYVTMVSRSQDNSGRLVPGGTSLWILVLNRGDRRLGSVLRRQDGAGRTYEALSLSLAKQSGVRPQPGIATIEDAPPGSSAAAADPIFVEPPIAR
ncbi:hypothetical protein [Rhodoligotrophos ferricapiens]|uniref:hypothetical protein n=1 Tax=Rhodoligotrophos ferricapiens TaxID=3069264 RepID=UPI00315D6F06